ncbi:MAG: DNA alkylation repair protein [Chloroflexi bacterium]|nr:DNA alkylation repair protein [Chloroflexota bacterium]
MSLADQILAGLQSALRAHADPARASAQKRYFKEPIATYGLPVPQVRALAKAYRPRLKKEAGLEDVLALCQRLLATGGLEEGLAVETLMEPFVKLLDPEHFPILDRWVDHFSNWAVTDGVSVHVIGALLERHPALAGRLVPWTAGASRWRRRAACVSLVIPVRHGRVSPAQVFAVTDPLMLDKDDMVQKGAGWILRDFSISHQDEVVEYLKKYPAAGRTLVRYALEKMPEDVRRQFITCRA